MTALSVKGDRVCLRARPDGQSEVVLQVSSGTVLQSSSSVSNWVEVLAPDESPVWISADLLSNGVVHVPKAYVRAGPGRNYQIVGYAGKSEKLDVRGQEVGWIKVGPPGTCRLWINRSFVEPLPHETHADVAPKSATAATSSVPPAAPPVSGVSAVTPAEARPPVVAAPAPAAGAQQVGSVALAPVPPVPAQAQRQPATPAVDERKAVPPPAEIARYEMETDVEQGRQALYRGTMDRCNWLIRKPAPYRLLVKHPRRGVVTLCYVWGDPALLARVDGKSVSVSGREYRLKGVDRPVVVYESVLEDKDGATGSGDRPLLPGDR